MNPQQEAKTLIDNSQYIYIFPLTLNLESLINALALFYTLKESGKNVNLAIEELPERIKFLTPSLEYISYPKDFVISLPNNKVEITQIKYEKDQNNTKVFLTINKGNVKKDDISFYFSEPKPDLLITLGLKDINTAKWPNIFNKDIISQSLIINIDNQEENTNFGKINILDPEKSLSEMVFDIIKIGTINKNTATCLLTGLILASDNFKNKKTSSSMLEASAILIKMGAQHQEIVKNLWNNNI
jgi:hypothetical protein